MIVAPSSAWNGPWSDQRQRMVPLPTIGPPAPTVAFAHSRSEQRITERRLEDIPPTRTGPPVTCRDLGLWRQPQEAGLDCCMYIHFLGSGGRTDLPGGWSDETSIAALSPTRIDATASPADGAKLNVISIMCKTTVLVPPGSRITPQRRRRARQPLRRCRGSRRRARNADSGHPRPRQDRDRVRLSPSSKPLASH